MSNQGEREVEEGSDLTSEMFEEDLDENNPPRYGGLKGNVYWCGGGLLPTKSLIRPKSTLAYRPEDFKSACKVEEGCQQGLPETKWLYLDQKKSKITLTSWIDALRVYMDERGLDSVFRVYDASQGTETYLLKNWGLVRNKAKINKWIEDLKTGVA